MRSQECHNKNRTSEDHSRGSSQGEQVHFMTSFPQRSTHQASPYLSRFSVLTMGGTIIFHQRLFWKNGLCPAPIAPERFS